MRALRGLSLVAASAALVAGALVSAPAGMAEVASQGADPVSSRSAPAHDEGFAWGSNGKGQLGLGSSTNPVDVASAIADGANPAAAWQSIAAGYTTACGIAPDGSAYCWGDNGDGALGNGTISASGDDSVPVGVSGNLSWTSLTAGGYYGGPFRNHVCGVATGGDAYCWGYNGNGQLGNGTTNDDSVPHIVSGGRTWASVTAGGQHTCGITATGAAYCWGDNNTGQLGDGTQSPSLIPVAVQGNHQWESLSAGLNWTCGITQQDQAYCWGYNADGQLGNGTNSDDSVPVSVAPNANTSGGWGAIDAGYGSTCAIGLDGAAYCWGRNYYGQLGDMSTNDSSVPVQAMIPGGEPIRSIGVGTDTEFACATTTTNVYCWGDNTGGVLGNPAGLSPQLLPLAISPTWQSPSVVPKSLSVGGSFAALTVGAPDPTPPTPNPAIPASAPRAVSATASDRSASVSWVAPSSFGSFPVSHYLTTSSPGGRMCLVTAPALTCEVAGLANGTAYTFTVAALTGAGWSASSEPSNVVVPRATPSRAIVITGAREGSRIAISGSSDALGMGAQVTPWAARSGAVYVPGREILVSVDGTFTWSRQARARSTWRVYVTAGHLESNTVVFRRR